MKSLFVCGMSVLALAAAASAQNAAPPADVEIKDLAVIKVDGTPIYQTQIEDEIRILYGRQLSSLTPEQLEVNRAQIRKEVINQLIGNILMANAAQAQGIQVADADVEKAMMEIAAAIVQGGSVETFLKESGISRDRFKADTKNKILAQRVMEKVTQGQAAATDEEVKDYYQQNLEMFRLPESVKARHILIRTFGIFDDDELDAKRAKAESLRKKLLEDKAADFATLARENSDCPTAAKGGDLGQFARGEMEPEFERAAFSQEVGKIGEMVKSNYGYHIIKVDAHEKERQLTFEEVKGWIANKIAQDRRQDTMIASLNKWREGAKIEVIVPEGGTPKPAAPKS